jgi:ABC-type transport system involved in cytochrome c biogenesis permease component
MLYDHGLQPFVFSLCIIFLFVLIIILQTTSREHTLFSLIVWFGFLLWCLTPLSTVFQLYRGGKFYWRRKLEDPVKTIYLPQVNDKLYHTMLHLAHIAWADLISQLISLYINLVISRWHLFSGRSCVMLSCNTYVIDQSS